MRDGYPRSSSPTRAGSYVLRGPAPDFEEDVRALKMRGVTTVLCLRSWDGPAVQRERAWCERAGIAWRHIPMSPVFPPSQDQLEHAVDLVGRHALAKQTVYVHCRYGVDRTGMVIAAWKLANGSSYSFVLGDLLANGFHLGRFFWWLPTLRRLASAMRAR